MAIKFAARKDEELPIASDDSIIYSDNDDGNDAHYKKNGRFAPKGANADARFAHQQNIRNFYKKIASKVEEGEPIAEQTQIKTKEEWDNLTQEQKDALNDALFSKFSLEASLWKGYTPMQEENYQKTKDYQAIKRLAQNYIEYSGQRNSFKPFKISESYQEALKRFEESAKIIGAKGKGIPDPEDIDSSLYSPYAAAVAIPQIMQEFWDKGIPCDVVKNPYHEEDKRGIDYWFYFKGPDGKIYRRNVDQKGSNGNIKIGLYKDYRVSKDKFGKMTLDNLYKQISSDKKEIDSDLKDWGLENTTQNSFNQRYIRGKKTENALKQAFDLTDDDLKEAEGGTGEIQRDMLTDDYLFINYQHDEENRKTKVSNAYISKMQLHKNLAKAVGENNFDEFASKTSKILVKYAATDLGIENNKSSQKMKEAWSTKILKDTTPDGETIYKLKRNGIDCVLRIVPGGEDGKYNCNLYAEAPLTNVVNRDAILNIDHPDSGRQELFSKQKNRNGTKEYSLGSTSNFIDESDVYHEEKNENTGEIERPAWMNVVFAKKREV